MKTSFPSRWRAFLSPCAAAVLLVSAQAAVASVSNAMAAWRQSVAAEQAGDFKQARDLILQYRNSGGDPYLSSLRAGWLSVQLKDYGKAETYYEAAAQASPSAVTPLQGLILCYEASGMQNRALAAVDRLGRMSAEDRHVLFTEGRVYYNNMRWRDAERAFREAFDQAPEDANAVSGLAWTLLRASQKRDAAILFERLLMLAPQFPYAQDGYDATHR